MSVNNKRLVSVRLTGADLTRVKCIAERLGVRDSDVIRFALKTTLAKLAPLHNDNVRGSELLPVFAECGAELTDYFELDSNRLDGIINDGVDDPSKRVLPEDLQLLCMTAMPEHYLQTRLRDLVQAPIESIGTDAALRLYLYKKYLRNVNTTRRSFQADTVDETDGS